MHSRLIFLHRLQRFEPHACVFPRQILRLDVEVGRRATGELEAALLPKSVAGGPRKVRELQCSCPY
jgi:hypothetical protein